MKTEYLAEVAYLISHGFSQGEIAALLGLGKNPVSLLDEHARAIGLIRQPEFCKEVFCKLWPDPEHRISLDDLRAELNLHHGLKEQGAATLMHVKILAGVSDGTSPEAWSIRLLDFGRQALPHLQQTLSAAKTCGLGWGSTLGALVSGAERHGFTGSVPHPTLVATCGELWDFLSFRDSSSSLVERLHSLIDGRSPNPHTLRGLPAFLDPSLRDFFARDHSGYRAIFGPKNALAERFDTIITSVGASGQKSCTAFKKALVARWGIKAKQLQKMAWGDIGGALVPRHTRWWVQNGAPEPREPLAADLQAELDRASSLWTGISIKQYRDTARRASGLESKEGNAKSKPITGVVIYAIGKNKAKIVHEVVKAGLVNRLVIDLDLAKALARLAKIDLKKEVQSTHQPLRRMETVQKVITAFEHLSDADKARVQKHLCRKR
jgi:DNA-binding transcriptional regulator LsrR (DeoR family)